MQQISSMDFKEELTWTGRGVKLNFLFIPVNIIESFLDFLFKVSIDSKLYKIIHYQEAFQQIHRIQAGNCRVKVIY